MTHIYEINNLVDFLDKHKINAEQFMYCLLLYNDKRHNRIPGTQNISRPLSKLYQYHHNIRSFERADLTDLIDKKLVEKTGLKLTPDSLEVTDKFIKDYLGDKFKYDELTQVYPYEVANFNHPGGRKIPLQMVKNHTDTVNTYNSFVRTNKLHKQIIEAVEWAAEKDLINTGIERFVSSKGWEYLFKMMNESHTDSHEVI